MTKQPKTGKLPKDWKYNEAEAEAYVRERYNVPVTFGPMMEILKCMTEMMADLGREIDRKDANALVEAAAMKRLESQAQAVRDHCASFLYTRTAAEAAGAVTKELPSWLR